MGEKEKTQKNKSKKEQLMKKKVKVLFGETAINNTTEKNQTASTT